MAKIICEEFVSARIRFRDQIQLQMPTVQAAWEKIASDAADFAIEEAEHEIEELGTKDGKASEMQSWTKWLQELVKFKQIDWAGEIDRFKMV